MIWTGAVLLDASADTEPNDDFSEAENITEGGPYAGMFDESGDYYDYYKFGITAGDIIVITFQGNSNDLFLTLYDEDENWLAELDPTSGQTETLTYYTSYETGYTLCYLEIYSDVDLGTYTFSLSLTPQNDAGSGGDAPDDVSDGLIVTGGSIIGEINSGSDEYSFTGEDDMDCYRFWAGAGDMIRVSFTSAADDYLYLDLQDTDEDYVFQLEVRDENTASDEYWTANETDEGWWYISVWQDMAPGQYTITLEIVHQNDAGSGEDAPENALQAIEVTAGNKGGHLEDDDRYDAYKFMAGSGDVISLDFSSLSDADELYLELFGQDTSSIGTIGSVNDVPASLRYQTKNETGMGYYTVKVWMDTDPGDYVFSLGITPQNDAGTGDDANGTIDTRISLGEGTYDGSIMDEDTYDYYKLPVGPSMIVDINFTSQASTPGTLYYYMTEGYLGFTVSSQQGSGRSGRYCFDDLAMVHDSIIGIGGGMGDYGVVIDTSLQNDAGSGKDAYSQVQYLANATPLAEGSFSAYMDINGDVTDAYLIDMTAGWTLNVTIDPVGPMTVSMRDVSGTVLATIESLIPGDPFDVSWTAPETGQVVMVLSIVSGSGDYTMDVSKIEPSGVGTPGAPVLAAFPGAGNITISWTVPADDGGSPIQGYNIFKKTTGTLFPAQMIAQVDANVRRYVDTMVMPGSTYEYYVAARNSEGEGAASNTVSASPEEGGGPDTDGDGMPDAWETQYGLDPESPSDAGQDLDGDGFSNIAEYTAGSSPDDIDSTPDDRDGDGMPDDWEMQYELNPSDPSDATADPDRDGRNNLKEYEDGTHPFIFNAGGTGGGGGGDDDDLPWGWIGGGCCVVLLFIVVLAIIIMLVVTASRKNKDKKATDEE